MEKNEVTCLYSFKNLGTVVDLRSRVFAYVPYKQTNTLKNLNFYLTNFYSQK